VSEDSLKRTLLFLITLTFLVFATLSSSEAFSQKRIPAKAAVVMDTNGAVLYAMYPNAKLAPASTVKLVTAMVVLDCLKPEAIVKISRDASKVRTIPPRLCPDEEFTVADLLHLALMKSINTAAVALAEAVSGSEREFTALMNRKAKELGASSTLFANASGLPKGLQYSTAGDLVLIMKAALTYPLIREILGTKAYLVKTAEGRELYLENSNDLLWQKDNIIGGKTGYTGNARHCFVCAINTEKGPLFTVVLGARSRRGLWKSTLLLEEIGMKAEFAYMQGKSLILPAVSH